MRGCQRQCYCHEQIDTSKEWEKQQQQQHRKKRRKKLDKLRDNENFCTNTTGWLLTNVRVEAVSWLKCRLNIILSWILFIYIVIICYILSVGTKSHDANASLARSLSVAVVLAATTFHLFSRLVTFKISSVASDFRWIRICDLFDVGHIWQKFKRSRMI